MSRFLDFSALPTERLQSIMDGADDGLRSHHARILADKELTLRKDMAGRCAACRTRGGCCCSAEEWLGSA